MFSDYVDLKNFYWRKKFGKFAGGAPPQIFSVSVFFRISGSKTWLITAPHRADRVLVVAVFFVLGVDIGVEDEPETHLVAVSRGRPIVASADSFKVVFIVAEAHNREENTGLYEKLLPYLKQMDFTKLKRFDINNYETESCSEMFKLFEVFGIKEI